MICPYELVRLMRDQIVIFLCYDAAHERGCESPLAFALRSRCARAGSRGRRRQPKRKGQWAVVGRRSGLYLCVGPSILWPMAGALRRRVTG